jgi:lactose/L-arabinose transport system ATP-binding protein
VASLALTQVTKAFDKLQIIGGVDLDIADGEFVVFVGPSGCGKSTLLRMIAGLETTSGGEIRIGDRVVNDVEPAERGIAMVFQSYALYPHMTVEENLSFGLRMVGNDKADTARRVDAAARILQIEPLLKRRPKQLSGGQRQRVAIGRAIVREPEVFLFDEPLSNLDAELRVQMRVELTRLHKRLGTTMIYVTHDQTEAMTMADKIVVLRAGKVEQTGRPLDLYRDPDNRFVAGFIGSPRANFLGGRIVERVADGAVVELTGRPGCRIVMPVERGAVGDEVTLGVRPEHFGAAGAGDLDIELSVDVVEQLGATSYAYAGTDGPEPLVVQIEPDRMTGSDERFVASISAKRSWLFDSDGQRLR